MIQRPTTAIWKTSIFLQINKISFRFRRFLLRSFRILDAFPSYFLFCRFADVSAAMIETQKAFKESSHWFKLAFCANVHIKNALRRILHNNVNDCTIKRCPSDPEELYQFLQNNKNKIQKSRCIKSEQLSILLPTSTKSVDSSSLDISLLRYLIQTFCHIKNAHGKWDEPVPSDKTICAYVYRAANIRNTIFHYSNIEKLDEIRFEEIWKKMKDILTGLKYFEDIEAIKAIEPLDPTKLQGEILQGIYLIWGNIVNV